MTPMCCICSCEIPDEELAVDSVGFNYHEQCLEDNPVVSPFDLDWEDEEQ